jgi:DNA-binding transcriptional MerR regulator/effector-binding domain-containing protein
MSALLTIGEFSKATHLSVKALRHYDDLGLLTPTDVDPMTGYRLYATAQVPAARLIRRFRELDMPLEQVQAVLDAPDIASRDAAILEHLQRMEGKLEETQATIASLRALLDGRTSSAPVDYRDAAPVVAYAVRETVDWDAAVDWLDGAFGDLSAYLEREGVSTTGPSSALYSPAFFEAHTGEVVAYVPVADRPSGAAGRVMPTEIPGARLAITMHRNSFDDTNQTYAALGTHVAERKLGADGPIREHYVVTEDDTDDPAELRTEVCWPVRAKPKTTRST